MQESVSADWVTWGRSLRPWTGYLPKVFDVRVNGEESEGSAVRTPAAPSPPLAPYKFMAVMLGATAALAILLSLAPTSNADLARLDLVVAGAFAALALCARFLLPRVPGDWGLDALLVLVIVTAGYGMLLTRDGESQVLIGLGLVLFSVFAAYFRPRPRFAALLILLVAVYLVCATINRQTGTPLVPLAVVVVIIGVSVMVAVLADRLRHMALIDPLTGALNRRGLDVASERIRTAALRNGVPVTVGLADVDRFKEFNDRLGHRAGDEMLVEVATAWRGAMGGEQLVARYGGDEFALILPGVRPDDARVLASRLPRPAEGTWTVGFCEWDLREDLDDALGRADAAMFRAKRGG